MWKELIERLAAGSPFGDIREFLDPTTLDAIREAEGKLSITFPSDLRELLLEANGIWGPGGGLIWTVERIVKDNTEFRSYPDFGTVLTVC
jgi:cell wall assembly regulator SMI1